MRKRHLAAFNVLPFLAGSLWACGGSTSGGDSVKGTVSGTTFGVASEMAVTGGSGNSSACTGPDGGNPTCSSDFSRQVEVIFTSRSDANCAAIQRDAVSNTSFQYANFGYLSVGVNVAGGEVVAGTYDIVTNDSATGASAVYMTTTTQCDLVLSLPATSGTVTLTQVSSTSVAGTYTVTFGTHGTFSGSFDVAICDYDAGTTTAPPTQVCQP